MGDSLTLLDMFVRGIAVGGVLVIGGGVWRSRAMGRSSRIATLAASISIAAWLITESATLWGAMGRFYPIAIAAYPISGVFWLFVLTVFGDRPLTAWNLTPTGLLLATGFLCEVLPLPEKSWMWALRNIAGGLLTLHAVAIIAQGWGGDLVEGRRRLRGLVIGVAATYGIINIALAFISRVDPEGPWLLFTVGWPYGGAIFAVIAMTAAIAFVQAQPTVFGASRRLATVDGRAEAAERLLLQKLNAFMAADGWRREGLTIGEVARQLEEPEHRLRRLINQRLGHRNFADFVNSYRIEAAKRRLADPQDARTTIAAIAFDLGYGSLGPFNRAFRAATGATPTEWRRQALHTSPELQEAV